MYQQQPMPWLQQPATPWSQQQVPAYQMPQQQYSPGSQMLPIPGFAQPQQPTPAEPGMLPIEQSYIENILRLNRGKIGTFYMTFENNAEWNAKIFRGVIEEAGRDHIIIRDPQSGKHFLLLMVYLDYVTFDEDIEYEYPYDSTVPISEYSPR